MKSKLYCIIILAILLLGSVISTVVPAKEHSIHEIENNDLAVTILRNPESSLEDGINGTIISTNGPIGSLFSIADINFIDGDPIKILFIELMLETMPYLLRPYISIRLNDVAFSIKYTRNIPQLPFIKRFSYETEIDEDGNISTYTEKHTLLVTGFTGTFGYFHKKPILLYPAYFSFIGSCEEVIVFT
jgi:hypothetical protein